MDGKHLQLKCLLLLPQLFGGYCSTFHQGGQFGPSNFRVDRRSFRESGKTTIRTSYHSLPPHLIGITAKPLGHEFRMFDKIRR